MFAGLLLLLVPGLVQSAIVNRRATSTATATTSTPIPEYFQLTTELFAGPTATGVAPFLAETNPAPFGTASFVANAPLETAEPIAGANGSIFRLMGQLSPYFPNPSGFGVKELPLPKDANISQLHMLARHGSRYPTTNSTQFKIGKTIEALQKNGTKFSGALSFLNTWKYNLGAEIMVPLGRQELFDSGVLHYYQYAQLYNSSASYVFRTTTQDRMLKSAENFLAGFFDLDWQQKNIKLEHIIEQNGFNVSLAGYFQCNNSNTFVNTAGNNATAVWNSMYLKNATARFQKLTDGFNWTVAEVYAVQGLCPYETVAFGYSVFCNLFTYDEWEGFEFSIDLNFAGNNMFQSPVGRAVGIGYVQEVLARLNHHVITEKNTQNNVTLDSMPSTFPVNQSLYFDFSHDTNIASILTAFGLTQFAPALSQKGPIDPKRSLIVSHMEPFGARLDIEIIDTPRPVAANRTNATNAYECSGEKHKYIHFLLNQRTVPLGHSIKECGDRTDGWCDLSTFLDVQKQSLDKAEYKYACFGTYPASPFGQLTDGVPPPPAHKAV